MSAGVKPPTFDYHRPATVAEALAHARRAGRGRQGARRRAEPGAAAQHAARRTEGAGRHQPARRRAGLRSKRRPQAVRVGALARHARLTRDGGHATALPILGQATAHVAHETIRNRGTTVGSIVHADPAAEMPAVLLLCDGSVELASAAGTRTVPAAEFFVGPLESALRAGRAGRRGDLPGAARSHRQRLGRGVPPGRRLRALCGLGLMVTLDDDRTHRGGPGRLHLGRADPGAGRPHRRGRRVDRRRRRLGRGRRAGAGHRSSRTRTSTPPPTTAGIWSAC